MVCFGWYMGYKNGLQRLFLARLNIFYRSKKLYSDSGINDANSPLAGLKVLDLTRIMAGPYATMLLGDLGAEIIKIEKPGEGDETRNWGPPFNGTESTYFLSINRNKKSVVVDLKSTKGAKIIAQLASKCDVLIENYIPGKLEKCGLGYHSLKTQSPQLIYCSLTGYGSTGPYKERAGYDVMAAAMGGLLHITGPEGGEPVKVGVPMTDLATGIYAHAAVMAALIHRQKTGMGQKIDCDLLSTQVSMLVNIASNYLNKGEEAKRWGTAHQSIVPYQAFKTKDNYILIMAGSNQQFQNLCQRLDLENLLENYKYSDNRRRVENRRELIKILSIRILEMPTKHWLDKLDGSGLAYSPINSIKEVFNDPQILHQEPVKELHHPSAGNIKVVGPAVKFSESTNQVRTPSPILGQHTYQVLQSMLGLKKPELDSFAKDGIIEQHMDAEIQQ